MSASAPYAVTLGETMGLARASEVGSLALVSELRLGIGGAESNVAIALRRLGVASTWMGRVGSDSIGERIRRELRAEGVDLCVRLDPQAQTGLMVKEKRTTQSTRVWYYRSGSAGSRLCVDDLDTELLAGASVLHVTGITPGLSESAHQAVFAAIDIARDAGVPVSFDVNHREAVWAGRDAHPVYRRLAAAATIVFAGEEEAALVTPESARSPFALAWAISELGPTEVVIKLGARGCVAQVDGVRFEKAAVPVTVVDTVGAGDAFVGGYLAERILGRAVTTRLETAVAAGAFACLSPGDWEGLPNRADLHLLAATEPVSR